MAVTARAAGKVAAARAAGEGKATATPLVAVDGEAVLPAEVQVLAEVQAALAAAGLAQPRLLA